MSRCTLIMQYKHNRGSSQLMLRSNHKTTDSAVIDQIVQLFQLLEVVPVFALCSLGFLNSHVEICGNNSSSSSDDQRCHKVRA
jgi:hypothetical protein